jgi:hypothetical protein
MRTLLTASMLAVLAIGCSTSPESGSTTSSEPPKAAASSAETKAQTACELLSPAEIAGFLKVPEVRKDDLNSGKNGFTGVDICNWYVKEGGNEGVEVRMRRAESSDEGAVGLTFNSAKSEAVEHDVQRSKNLQPVKAGDEAVYGPFAAGTGGSIVVRVGPVVATMTGSASKDVLVEMATLAAQRM